MRLETDDFLARTDINFHDDEEKLPDIMYAFWKWLFTSSPLSSPAYREQCAEASWNDA